MLKDLLGFGGGKGGGVKAYSKRVPEFITRGDKRLFIWEPKGDGPFPVIAYAHGLGQGGEITRTGFGPFA